MWHPDERPQPNHLSLHKGEGGWLTWGCAFHEVTGTGMSIAILLWLHRLGNRAGVSHQGAFGRLGREDWGVGTSAVGVEPLS